MNVGINQANIYLNKVDASKAPLGSDKKWQKNMARSGSSLFGIIIQNA